ncbi:hypothetical protein F4811DRAFT_435250 [Daldinia bambusicola]|nr:hypothetical protein F4811DRAFT_435250 [Daldinia bambusicola]
MSGHRRGQHHAHEHIPDARSRVVVRRGEQHDIDSRDIRSTNSRSQEVYNASLLGPRPETPLERRDQQDRLDRWVQTQRYAVSQVDTGREVFNLTSGFQRPPRIQQQQQQQQQQQWATSSWCGTTGSVSRSSTTSGWHTDTDTLVPSDAGSQYAGSRYPSRAASPVHSSSHAPNTRESAGNVLHVDPSSRRPRETEQEERMIIYEDRNRTRRERGKEKGKRKERVWQDRE